MRKCLLALLVLVCINLFAQEEDRILNEYIIMLKPGHTIEHLLQEQPSLKINRCLSQRMNIWLAGRNTKNGAEDFLYALYKSPDVKLAQFNHQFEQRAIVPNDPYFDLQWNMLNTGQTNGVPGADIEATEAWEINHSNLTANGDTLVVAIIDGRFNLTHEDINFFTNYQEAPGNGIDDDQNGYIDDVNGWNAYDTSGDVNSTGGNANHSTHLAGIAGAKGNNGKGIAGVCWGVQILPVTYGSTMQEAYVVNAYDYVREMRILHDNTLGLKGAFVVATNSSFGLNFKHPGEYPIWCAMYDSMGTIGILSAAATANSSYDVDVQGDMPTECPSKWLITVTNTNSNDQRAIAAYGKNNIDIGAPGSAVYSSIPINAYTSTSGTSMAAPHVAGAVAAMYAAACKGLINAYYERPDSIALLIKDYLLSGAEWNSSLNNITVTGGRLNLLRAIQNLKRFNCDSCNFDVDIQKAPIVCNGDSSGQLSAIITGAQDSLIYNWSNGIDSTQNTHLAPGFYMLTVTDTAGCRRIATAELHNPDNIFINSFNVVPATDSSPANITVFASAGRDHLLYSIDSINYQQSNIFSVPANSLYTVYVKNEEGCVVSAQVLVSGVGDLEVKDYRLNIFPNPANEALNILVETPGTTALKIQISNVVGQMVYETENNFTAGNSTFSINTSQLPDGLYYLSASAGKNMFTKKFVVTR